MPQEDALCVDKSAASRRVDKKQIALFKYIVLLNIFKSIIAFKSSDNENPQNLRDTDKLILRTINSRYFKVRLS